MTDGVTGEAEFYSDDEDEEPLDRRQPEATNESAAKAASKVAAPIHLSPQDASPSPYSSGGASLGSPRHTNGGPPDQRGSETKRLKQSTQATAASSQQPSQQPTPPSPPGQGGFNFAPRLLPRPVFQPHAASLSGDSPMSPTDRFIVQDEQPLSHPIYPHPPLVLSAEDRIAHPNVYTEASIFPLQDKQQAMLLRHFVQNLAIWVLFLRSFFFPLLFFSVCGQVNDAVLTDYGSTARPLRTDTPVRDYCSPTGGHLHRIDECHLGTLVEALGPSRQL